MSSHSGNLNDCLVVDGLLPEQHGGGKKRVIFRAVSLLAGLLPGVLFWDNNEGVISNNLAALILLLPELDRAGSLFPSPEGQGAPLRCQIARQSKFFRKKITGLHVERDREKREELVSKEGEL